MKNNIPEHIALTSCHLIKSILHCLIEKLLASLWLNSWFFLQKNYMIILLQKQWTNCTILHSCLKYIILQLCCILPPKYALLISAVVQHSKQLWQFHVFVFNLAGCNHVIYLLHSRKHADILHTGEPAKLKEKNARSVASSTCLTHLPFP